MAQISKKLDSRQNAKEGYSTTDALNYILQAIHEATDSGNCGARMFSADYAKGFDGPFNSSQGVGVFRYRHCLN